MEPVRAALLVRISDDREGEEKGVARQEKDGRALADRLGWTIAPDAVVVENDTSAFKRRRVVLPDGTRALRVVRPGFRRVLDMLASGEVNGFIAYDLDRACRDPRDLEDLIDVVEERRCHVMSVTGSLRLANDADITMARVMVAIANKSSRDTARRVARKHEELAEAGKPGGGGRRPYGYEPDGATVRPDEARIVRWMARRVLAGWSQTRICDELNRHGVRPSMAERWTSRSVSSILKGPRVTGLRRFRGQIVGEAEWPAILDRDTWEKVCTALDERAGTGANTLVHWLTGVLFCGLCGNPLKGASGNGGPRYWCATRSGGCGKIAITAAQTEAEVERQVLEYLSEPNQLAQLRSAHSTDAVKDARATLAEDEQQLKELARMWARRELSFAEYGEARKIINARVEQSRALVSASLPRTVRQLLAGGDVRAGWATLDAQGRRDIVRGVLPGYKVMPAGPGPRRFNPDRLVPIKD
jgi:DNA invertase Pin-like site-specific DNA recombinase